MELEGHDRGRLRSGRDFGREVGGTSVREGRREDRDDGKNVQVGDGEQLRGVVLRMDDYRYGVA